jgi:microcystin-dependent protein
MNRLNIAATGYPGTNKSWRFLHSAFAEPLKALAQLCGDKTILYGCDVNGITVSDGWISLDGELFYFKQSTLTQGDNTPVMINETIEQAAYNTDINNDTFFDNLNTYFERITELNNGQTTVCTFGELTRLKTLSIISTSITNLEAFTAICQPVGAVQMWSGSVSNIPDGWALCNGTNGTPDLRNRFVVGAGDQYNVNNIGGLKEVALNEAQMPKHKHTASTSTAGSHSHTGSTNSSGNHRHNYDKSIRGRGYETRNDDTPHGAYQNAYTGYSGNHSHSLNINSNGNHSHSVTINDTGNNEAHENRPPYYALCYIMFKGL